MNTYIIKSKLTLSTSEYNVESLIALIINRLLASRDDIVIIDSDSDRRWTAYEVYDKCLNFAYQLVTEYGLKASDLVCFLTPNSDYHLLALLGVLAAGGVYSAISPLSPYREVNEVLNDINPAFIIACKQNYDMARSVATNLSSFKKLFVIGDNTDNTDTDSEISKISIERITQIIRSDNVSLPIPLAGDQAMAIFMTSGSTGKQKQVMHTNRSLISMVNGMQNDETCPCNAGDVYMPYSLRHTFDFVPLLQTLIYGATVVMTPNEHWAEDLFSNIEKYRLTRAFLVPTNLYYMINNEGIVKKYDLSSLRDLYVAGSTLSESVYNQIKDKFAIENFRNGYGMTEIGPITQVYKSDCKTLTDCKTVGRPVAGVEVKIIDSNGDSLAANSVGEICVKSDQMMAGYRNHEPNRGNTYTGDGFLRTGDAGYYDCNEMFYIIGRFNDLINVESQMVSPIELETVLVGHPAVEEAAVIGIEDEERGEVPKAFVKIKAGQEIDEQSLQNFVNDRVYYLKRIRGGIEFVDEFPRTGIGKINKRELKQKL